MTKNIKDITVKENLDNARKKAHETMRKNGHYKRMTKLSIKARKAIKKKLSTVDNSV